MKTDGELLRVYAKDGDDSAFAEVVRWHVNLVHAAATRLLNGDTALAQDVTQAVFTDLARKADRLAGHASLAGWLHTAVRFAAAHAIRSEQRRRTHEREASAMTEHTVTEDQHWFQLKPLIDEAVGQLGVVERDAVLLRYFEGKGYREVGDVLGLTENAARMKVDRAVEKLRTYFFRHGLTTSAALLGLTLGACAAKPTAPTALASEIAGKSLAGVKLAAASTQPLFTAKLAWLSAGVAVAGVATVATWTHYSPPAAPAPTSPVPAAFAKANNASPGAGQLGNGLANGVLPVGIAPAASLMAMAATSADSATQSVSSAAQNTSPPTASQPNATANTTPNPNQPQTVNNAPPGNPAPDQPTPPPMVAGGTNPAVIAGIFSGLGAEGNPGNPGASPNNAINPNSTQSDSRTAGLHFAEETTPPPLVLQSILSQSAPTLDRLPQPLNIDTVQMFDPMKLYTLSTAALAKTDTLGSANLERVGDNAVYLLAEGPKTYLYAYVSFQGRGLATTLNLSSGNGLEGPASPANTAASLAYLEGAVQAFGGGYEARLLAAAIGADGKTLTVLWLHADGNYPDQVYLPSQGAVPPPLKAQTLYAEGDFLQVAHLVARRLLQTVPQGANAAPMPNPFNNQEFIQPPLPPRPGLRENNPGLPPNPRTTLPGTTTH